MFAACVTVQVQDVPLDLLDAPPYVELRVNVNPASDLVIVAALVDELSSVPREFIVTDTALYEVLLIVAYV